MRRIGTIPIVAGIILTTIAIAASLVAFGDARLFGNSETAKVFGGTKPSEIVNVVSNPSSPVAIRPSSLPSGVPLANGGQYATTYPVVNYGAKCDGTTDDSTAFAKAFAAIPSTGATLRLPAGTCIVNSTLHVVSNTAVVGAGKKLSVLKTDYASMPQIIVADGASNVRLSGFLLTRSVIATSGGDGIDTSLNSNTTNIAINWVAVENAYVGFKLGPAIDASTVQNCIADNNESDGFLFTFAAKAPSSIVLTWFVSHDISQFNGGIGFHYLAAADANISLVTMQTINNLLTDQNTGGGL
jgi:Pectate lyase superfamily protein